MDKDNKCPKCKLTKLTHKHIEAHGLSGTHMSGSEHYECECGYIISVDEGTALGFKFILDKPTKLRSK